MTDEEAKAICDKIRQTAYSLHLYLGKGYLEKVYENGLAHRLEKLGMEVLRQVPIQIHDEDGFPLGDYIADMIVNGIVVELKATTTIMPAHISQTINYLNAMHLDHGMIIDFGSDKFQCKKLVRRR